MKLVHDSITPHLQKLQSAFSQPIEIPGNKGPLIRLGLLTKLGRPVWPAPRGAMAAYIKMQREMAANGQLKAIRAQGLEIVRAEVERRLRNIR